MHWFGHTVLKCAQCLFGMKDMLFKGILVSNHCQTFVNTFCIAFPTSGFAQCFPDIKCEFALSENRNDIFAEQLFQKTNMMGPFHTQLHSIPSWLFGQKVASTRIFVRFTARKKTCFFAQKQQQSVVAQKSSDVDCCGKKTCWGHNKDIN